MQGGRYRKRMDVHLSMNEVCEIRKWCRPAHSCFNPTGMQLLLLPMRFFKKNLIKKQSEARELHRTLVL